jgi:hypothetical protein
MVAAKDSPRWAGPTVGVNHTLVLGLAAVLRRGSSLTITLAGPGEILVTRVEANTLHLGFHKGLFLFRDGRGHIQTWPPGAIFCDGLVVGILR